MSDEELVKEIKEEMVEKPTNPLSFDEIMIMWTHVIQDSYNTWSETLTSPQRLKQAGLMINMLKHYTDVVQSSKISDVMESVRKVEKQFEVLSQNILPRSNEVAGSGGPEINRGKRWKDAEEPISQ